jgi:hypothetical protein
MQANVSIVFLNGVGQVEAELIRNGNSIDMRATDKTGTLQFPDVLDEDIISLNGACTGNGEIMIDIPVLPPSPVNIQTGNFFLNFIVGK